MSEVYIEQKVLENGKVVRVCYDYNPENPREFDNLGKFWSPAGGGRLCLPSECNDDYFKKAPVKLKVRGYSHSGVAYKAFKETDEVGYPFNDVWDSGLAGCICASREDILKNWGKKKLTKELKEKTIDILKAEVDEYSQYANGEVYGWQVGTYTEDGSFDVEDSVWGYCDMKDAMEEGEATANA